MRGILTYHSIDGSGSPISIDVATFARHVAWLARGSVRVVPLEELAAAPDDVDALAITFDDGFANFADEAWPLLAEHGLPATVFVVSDLVGSTNAWEDNARSRMPVLPLMGWERLAELAGQGVSIGAHGRTHARLPGLAEARLVDELEGCAAAIQAETGQRASTLAYPYGAADSASAAAARSRFTAACTADLRLLSSGDDAHLLPRLDAYYLRSPGRLEAFGQPSFARYVRLRAAARAVRSWLRR